MQVIVQDEWHSTQACSAREGEVHRGEGIHRPALAVMLGDGNSVESQLFDAAQCCRPARGVVVQPVRHRRKEAERCGVGHGGELL